jgi:hypothetical protein
MEGFEVKSKRNESIDTICRITCFSILISILLLLVLSCNNNKSTAVDKAHDIAVSSPVSFSTCKFMPGKPRVDSLPSTQTGICYQYDGASNLYIEHINAAFNCCPIELTVDANLVNDTIICTELEYLYQGGCRCHCLFDIDYQVTGLSPGIYAIKIVEPYARASDEKLEFSVDLISSPTGTFAVDRDHYPWGL